jgi:peptidoglycan/xylan/chitin deacetylase (PgdA/CDA1 family)
MACLPAWKSLLLGLYYGGSMPLRWCRNARAAREGRAPVIVLFYHRIADDAANDWTCSNAMFARQIRWLKRHFELVSLEEAQRRIRGGNNPRACVSITFDDGYADNGRQALPLLIRERIPCTYFVCNEQVFDGLPFPHDRDAGQQFAPNTIDELRQFAAAGIEIGAHTRTHCDLGKIKEPERLFDEVVAAGEELQVALGRPVRYFAFPYGQWKNLNAEVFHLAYEAGYEAVCTAYGGINDPGDDAFHLQRIAADASLLRLKNWVTLDPRKSRLPRFEYELGMRPTRRKEPRTAQ